MEVPVLVRLSLGDALGGGRIFWISADSAHGLIAANEDISYGRGFTSHWGPFQHHGATSKTDGATNTGKMQSSATWDQHAGYPFIGGYVSNGRSGWYIPSIDELTQLFHGKQYISGLPVSPQPGYWSSTEVDIDTAYHLNMGKGAKEKLAKNTWCRIRPIRKF